MGWMELLLVGVIALIVVGPKDLPVMFQALGKMTAKVKRMGREFTSAMNDAADATGAADIAKDLKGLTSAKSLGIDKLKEAADSFDKWEPGQANKAMGSETAKLAAERAEQVRKIREKTVEVGQARLDKEAAEAVAEKAVARTGPTKKATPPKDKPATKPKPAAKVKPAPKAKSATKTKPAAKAKPAAKPAAKPKPAAKAKPKPKPKADT